jgi:hypothetical protein
MWQVGAALMTAALPTRPALAKTVNLTVKDLSTKLCANPQAAGVPGSSTYKVAHTLHHFFQGYRVAATSSPMLHNEPWDSLPLGASTLDSQ